MARRQITFHFSGRSLSPVYGYIRESTTLRARVEATTISQGGVASLVRVHGDSAEIVELRQRLAAANDARPGRVAIITDQPGALVFFDHCPTPTDGSVSVEQIALEMLGPAIVYESEIGNGECTVRVTAPPGADLDAFYGRVETALAARFHVRFGRIGASSPPERAVSMDEERALLAALAAGYFEKSRRVGVREMALGQQKSKSAFEETLRGAVLHLAERHTAWLAESDPTGTCTVTIEYWGATPRSPHYAHLMASPRLSARVEALNITDDAAWQVIVVDGPTPDITRLRAALQPPHPPPIEALDILQHEPTRLVFYDRWRRPRAASEGISSEHILYDHCGHAGSLRAEYRHGVGRITAIGPQPCVERFADELVELLGQRYRVRRIPQPRDLRDAEPKATRVFEAAAKLGYFDIPHRVGLAKIADETGVSASTASTLLRRAVRSALLVHVLGAARAVSPAEDSDPRSSPTEPSASATS